MFRKAALIAFSFFSIAYGQQVGTVQAENHPRLTWSKCTASGCVAQSSGSVVLDANWRWVHDKNGYTNCYTGNAWNTTICPNGSTCASNCALDGADYQGTYGITTSGNSLTLKFVTQSSQKNVGSRVYLLASDTRYEMFNLLNKEFTFDVDVSQLPCGLNGALYFSEMDADGGTSRFPTNTAGARYGTGYCDSQCARDIKFINGEANVANWTASPTDPNAGTGQYGACCGEMDIWEANSISTAYTPHPCTSTGQVRCSGTACGGPNNRYGSVCDPDGCDFNSYRQGVYDFYGPGSSNTIDTTKKVTVVTQFYTSNNSTTGTLSEIRRIYVQDGRVIQNSKTTFSGISPYDSITSQYCADQKTFFNDHESFASKGGMAGMGRALARGMVLVMSIWDDHYAHMLWLDSTYPTDADPSIPGKKRGTCPTTSGDPKDVEAQYPNAQVTFSNIRFGDIGTTYTGGGSTSNPGTPTTTTSAPAATQTRWGQCGGQGWTGPTACESGTRCVVVNQWYHQCQ
ncbi:hypothetical protein AX16_009469 [Volvariella volvacea WC 439]|nr:hypothetical protein AX16_009469 [Volvariella volvacea WC 439]